MTEIHIAGGTEYDISDMRVDIISEGCQTGTPAVCIRLENEGAPDRRRQFVDRKAAFATEIDTTLWTRTAAEQIARAARDMAGTSVNWALLYGASDPARQRLRALVDSLHSKAFSVTIETGGEYDGILNAGADWLVLLNPTDAVLPGALAQANEIRYSIGEIEDAGRMLRFYQEHDNGLGIARRDTHVERVVIPTASEQAVDLCLMLAKQSGYRLATAHQVRRVLAGMDV